MTLIEKLENNERLSYEDGVALYELDLFTLGHYANMRRRARHGNKAFFNINRHINPTNICKDICKFCAFSANRKNPNPYTMSHEEILSILDDSVTNRGITEVHIVSAHNPDTGLEQEAGTTEVARGRKAPGTTHQERCNRWQRPGSEKSTR